MCIRDSKWLKPGGHFLITIMDWLPFESEIAMKSEKLILKYNPAWSGCGRKRSTPSVPKCAEGLFDAKNIIAYATDIPFTSESWNGRIKACRGIEASLTEKGYGIEVAVTKNRLNDEAIYLEGLLKGNVSGLIIEGSRSAFPNPNIRLYKEIKRRNIPTLFIHNHYENMPFDSVEMSDSRSAYELTRILIENGHRRIGGIFKYDDRQGIERYKGFVQCLSDYGVKFDDDCIRWYSTKDMEEKLSKKGLLRMYRRTKDCTAMMVYNLSLIHI